MRDGGNINLIGSIQREGNIGDVLVKSVSGF